MGLRRSIGFISGSGLTIGAMVGSGIFMSPGEVLGAAGSVGTSLLMWGTCGLISCAGALCFLELGLMYPESGGAYVYINEALGDLFAFLYAWSSILIVRPASAAIGAVSFADYMCEVFYEPGCAPSLLKKLIGMSLILFLGMVNAKSLKLSSWLNNLSTVGKVLALIIIIICGIVNLFKGYTEHLQQGFEPIENDFKMSVGALASAFYAGMWSFDGWEALNSVGEEVANPGKNFPRVICTAVPFVSILYVLTNVAYLTLLSPTQVVSSDALAFSFASKYSSEFALFMAASVALSTFGAANGNCLTGARLTLAGARNGHLPRMLAYLSITERLPILSVIFNSALSIILLIPENSNFLTLVNFTGFTIWIFYGMAFAAVLILRWKCPDIRRRYKVPLILPILCALVALFMTIAPIVASPEIEYLVVCGIIAAGLLIYIPLRLEFSFSLGVRAINWIEKQLQLLLEVAPYEKLASE